MAPETQPETRVACAVLAKWPRAGAVKTRLAELLGEEGAADLARAMLRDQAERLGEMDLDWTLFLDMGEGEDLPEAVQGFPVLPQRGEGLGERIARSVESLWEEGAQGVVVLGTDAPNFPDSLLLHALRHLESGHPSVLGPALDGGLYLLGFRRPSGTKPGELEELLAPLPWETAEIGAAVRQVLEPPWGPPLLLDVWYDVDRPEDLKRLRRDLEDPTSAGHYARHTLEWLRRCEAEA